MNGVHNVQTHTHTHVLERRIELKPDDADDFSFTIQFIDRRVSLPLRSRRFSGPILNHLKLFSLIRSAGCCFIGLKC